MSDVQRFPYAEVNPSLGTASALPYVPLTLERDGKSVTASGLVDSGAALSVIPYHVGLQLGAVWDHQSVPVKLAGNLAKSDARAILVMANFGHFAPVRLAFAWTKNDQVPIILGQVNFFMEFEVCFYRSHSAFEITPKEKA